jgi:NAD(P)-dependent dehydrogenase (short-subunit alcohol dehydrogenase family)
MNNGRIFTIRTIKELFELSGQVALISGGATGIGRQMAIALAEAGANLVIASRKLKVLTEAAEAMEKELGVKVLPIRCDITKAEEINGLFEQVMKKFGRLDILINSSGATWGAPSLEYPMEGWQKVINTNVNGVWLMCQKAGQIMSKQRYGRIINISSMYGLVGSPIEVMDAVAYQTSKAAIIGLTRELAVKWATYRITVNALAPGWFPSTLTKATLEKSGKEILRFIPMGRFGEDDELKAAALFLASPGASYCTGVVLSIDGGAVSM